MDATNPAKSTLAEIKCSQENSPDDGLTVEYLLDLCAANGFASVTDAVVRAQRAEAEIERLRAALTEISKGEGIFNRDPLTFATNTIESMKQIALDALVK